MKTMSSPSSPTLTRKMVIAGPCAAESREQIVYSIQEARGRDVDFVRVSLWKPRTKPGFDGLKEEGIPLLIEALQMGANPATEVLTAQQAEHILDEVLPHVGDRRLMLWIGARNQNHQVQQEIARACARDARVTLMVKNQPWCDESHWEGIAEHLLEGGIAPENVVLCHRGFNGQNTMGYRNAPDSEMAMRVREKTGMRMILDLSHTAGIADKVLEMGLESVRHDYDGLVVEVHPNPRFAWTDAKQQLTWDQFDAMMAELELESSRNRQESLKVRQA